MISSALGMTPYFAPAAVREVAVSGPFLPWLAPACILAGVAAQLAVLALCRADGKPLTARRVLACAAGALLVLAGAILDRDVTVGVGQTLACIGIWFAWRG